VRLQLRDPDGVVILLHYTGLVEQNRAFQEAAQQSRETQFDTNYLRMSMCFEVGAPRYKWLMQHLFVARGRLLSSSELAYEVYRVD
jgi:hypothetical protein